MGFCHLHVHCEHSLLDGAIKITDLVKKVSDMGQTHVAITDHGWMAGAVRFVTECKKAGVMPIVGMETYVSTKEDLKEKVEHGGDNYHLTLVAQNQQGYHNLMAITSRAHLEGFFYKPRVNSAILTEHSEGIIVLSGCIGAEIPQLITHRSMKKARQKAEWFASTFPGRFFIEVQNHGATGGVDHVRTAHMYESELNDALRELADDLGIPLVATNDAHYLEQQDADAHDSLMCLQMSKWRGLDGYSESDKSNKKNERIMFPGFNHGEDAWSFYVKSEQEMKEMSRFGWWREACDNTIEVARMIETVDVETAKIEDPETGEKRIELPPFEVPQDDVAYEYFKLTGEVLL